MNGLESAYAAHLDLLKAAEMVQRWDYEPEKFRLAKSTFYTPDFRVIRSDGLIEFHEVKGYWEDDARVKCKVFAELHPMYMLIAVTKKTKKAGGGWEYEYFGEE